MNKKQFLLVLNRLDSISYDVEDLAEEFKDVEEVKLARLNVNAALQALRTYAVNQGYLQDLLKKVRN